MPTENDSPDRSEAWMRAAEYLELRDRQLEDYLSNERVITEMLITWAATGEPPTTMPPTNNAQTPTGSWMNLDRLNALTAMGGGI